MRRGPLVVAACFVFAGLILLAVWMRMAPAPDLAESLHGAAQPLAVGATPSENDESAGLAEALGDADGELIVRNSLRPVDGGDRAAQLSVTPLEGHVDGVRIDLLLPDLVMEPLPEGMALRMPGERGHFRQGVPDLPVVSRLIDGQEGGTPRVELLNASFRDLPNLDVAPMPWAMTRIDLDGSESIEATRVADDDIYGGAAFWPGELVQVEQARQRGKTHVRLSFNPVQYNPVTRTIRYYEQISARLVFEPASSDEVLSIEPASSPSLMSASDPCDCPGYGRESAVPPSPNGVASEFAVRRAGAEVGAHYRFSAQSPGLYRITGAVLLAAGAPASSLVGSEIRVYNRDREVAVSTSTAGPMGADDWILLYATGFDGLYTGSNVYWIGFGGEGLRMAVASGAPIPAAAVVNTHCQTITYDKVFPGVTPFFNGFVLPQTEALDHWYARQLTSVQSGPLEQLTVDLPTDFPVAGGDARVCARLVGVTVSNHLTRIRFNNQFGADFQWYQQPVTQARGSLFEGSEVFSSSVLTHPTSTLNVSQQVVGPQFADQVNIETIRLIYPRQLKTASDRLAFTGQVGARNYRVSNLSALSDIRVLDISDVHAPRQLTGFTASTTPSDGVQVEVGVDAALPPALYICRTQTVQQVTAIEKVSFRNLGDPERGADWIVVTPFAFRDSVYMLTTNRYVQGSRVVVAPLPDIYNEFGYGIADAEAIRHFIGYAYHHWRSPAPLGVLLAGRATLDPRNYRNFAVKTVIPTLFGGTTDTYTGLDTKMGLVDGTDNLADVVVGRILAGSNAEVQGVVDKILSFERMPIGSAVRGHGTLVTGRTKNPGENFNASADLLAGIMNSAGFTTVQKLYDCNCNAQIRSAINAGRFTVSYMGHGAADRWDASSVNTASNLWTSSDVASLSNTVYPIVSVFTCQNGYYLSPTQTSLAQAFLQTAAKGASALVAPTALSQAIASDRVADGFYEAFAADEVRSLGEAMMNGQLKLFSVFGNSPTELLMYQVFGDPGMIVNPQTSAP